MTLFEVAGHQDEGALATLQEVFPDRIIETVNFNDVGKHGGLLNCITWSIQTT
jgi:agmatine deiminase